jgi:hypothetical protein
MARKFLWVVTALIVLVIATAVVWRLAGDRVLRFALVPATPFRQSVQAAAPDYATPAA